ncbi:MAG: H-NS histone family protein [Pseudomonadota bacterium]|nr:H-NS histone family protein [Pseudomonadota bacterium]
MAKQPLSDLLAQKAALEQQIADMQREQRSDAVDKVKALMAEHGLSVADIGGRGATAKRSPSKVAPKYRNPASGETWSGRGLKPRWLSAAIDSGKSLSDFTI